MIAQKLPNNEIIITNKTASKDAIQIIPNLTVSELYSLTRSTDQWLKKLDYETEDMMIAYATDKSSLGREFNRIYLKRMIFNGRSSNIDDVVYKGNSEQSGNNKNEGMSGNLNESKQNKDSKIVSYKSTVKGLYRLSLFKNTDTIRLVKRGNNHINKPNSVCIPDYMKNDFINEDIKRFTIVEISKANSPSVYKKWQSIINKLYKDGLKEIMNENN